MPLYFVTKSRHAVFHRSMARLLAAAVARQPEATMSLRPDGDFMMVASALLRTLRDWLAIATADADRSRRDLAWCSDRWLLEGELGNEALELVGRMTQGAGC